MTTLTIAEPAAPASAPRDKGLRAGTLGLLSSVVIAVSSTAPAYSMAATLGLIVAVVGVHSPGTLIVSFLPMLCIAYAFRELNKADPDCGTTFTWTARAFGPRTGWMGGWGIIAADIIVMASLSQIAGRYFLELAGAGAAGTFWVTAVGVAFIALLTWVCYRGIEVSARLQQVLLVIEVGALTVFAVVALVMGIVSALFYVLLTAVSKNVLADSAASVGLLIAFYYGLTGFACVWFFRRDLLRSPHALLVKGVLPLVGGLTLLGAFVLSIKSYWPAASSYSSCHGIGGAGRRKVAVLEAACRVIAERGADATRFADVAAESGVPVSTLQYYFGSREDLLVAAFRHASSAEIAALEADVAAISDPWEQLERIITRSLTGYQPDAPEGGRLWIESWHFGIRDAEMRADALRDNTAWRRLVAEVVRRGIGLGTFGARYDPDKIAVLTIAAVDGMGIPLSLADPQITPAGAAQDVMTALRDMLSPHR